MTKSIPMTALGMIETQGRRHERRPSMGEPAKMMVAERFQGDLKVMLPTPMLILL
jgi:hypothetical protein